jgi:predicted nucleic acid-binding protein
MMRVAIDSNVLLYAEGFDDLERRTTAETVLARLGRHEIVIPVQVLGEVFNILRRKFGRAAGPAQAAVAGWHELASYRPDTTMRVLSSALELATAHPMQIWDGIILAASAEAGCRLLLSEDMQDGFVWRGVTVVNPFAAMPHPLLVDATKT